MLSSYMQCGGAGKASYLPTTVAASDAPYQGYCCPSGNKCTRESRW
jgi:hypothetical protein